jgi:hypothetical protein
MAVADPACTYSLFGISFAADRQFDLPRAKSGDSLSFRLEQIASTADLNPAGDRVVQELADPWSTLRVLESGSIQIMWGDWLALSVTPDGRHVFYRLSGSTRDVSIEAYIANFAVSLALLVQGEETLHATVLMLGGTGIGLLGASGAGKSTLAAHLLGEGASLVTDDMLRLTWTGAQPFAEPGLPRLKLFEEAARRHFRHSPFDGNWNPLSRKFIYATDETGAGRQPLHSFVWLEPSGEFAPEGVSVRRLAGLELFRVLAGSTMNSKLQTSGRLARQLEYTRLLAETVPVFALLYPRRHDIFPEVVEILHRVLP